MIAKSTNEKIKRFANLARTIKKPIKYNFQNDTYSRITNEDKETLISHKYDTLSLNDPRFEEKIKNIYQQVQTQLLRQNNYLYANPEKYPHATEIGLLSPDKQPEQQLTKEQTTNDTKEKLRLINEIFQTPQSQKQKSDDYGPQL